jgi:hypothetical protein
MVCLPEWLVVVLVLAAGARGVLRDLIEHDGLSGVLRGSDSGPGSGPDEPKK